MRKNPDYAIYYNNWARLFVLGVIPALMLIYLNYKVKILLDCILQALLGSALPFLIRGDVAEKIQFSAKGGDSGIAKARAGLSKDYCMTS